MLMWYVIQVQGGREEAMAERIARVVSSDVLDEVFYPQYMTEIKLRGAWQQVQKPLFPGYLICITSDPRAVQETLLKLGDFARVLKQGDEYVPLGREEVELISTFTRKGERCVPMSEAFKDGDRVVVCEGPLLGREGLIKDINRHKNTAYLEVDLCGRRVSARVGLAVLTREQWAVKQGKRAIA